MPDLLPPITVEPIGRTAAEVVASARELEVAGYARVWCNETRFDAYALASAVAATTSRIAIGTAVAVWTRTPVQAVLACISIDQISGGRFLHGVGSGAMDRNEDWHGLPYRRAGARLREYLTCLRLAWDARPEAPARFTGEFYTIKEFASPTRPVQPRLPTYIGAIRPLACRLAGELADGVLLGQTLSATYIRDGVLPALEQGAARAGRPLRDYLVSAGQVVCVDRDRVQAIEWARRRLAASLRYVYYRELYARDGFGAEVQAAYAALSRDDFASAVAALSEEMVLAHTCAGTADDVRRQLMTWAPYVNDFRLRVPPELTYEEVQANWIQLLDVFPATRAGQ
jgi:alkanesulfonate monooxygenase SsuD/methylene tetrahydromethanopterin reductase-like flavin-dependent oxidoreductase (luciferase family)